MNSNPSSIGKMIDSLDQFVWMALTTSQRELALGSSGIRYYKPSYAPFAGALEVNVENLGALAAEVEGGTALTFVTSEPLPNQSWFDVLFVKPICQMIGPKVQITTPPSPPILELGEEDLPDMVDLVAATKPGPFREDTHRMGRYVGIREQGRLIAMTGERIRLTGYTEVSAVCARPEARGRGLAFATVAAITNGILRRGDTPILHVLKDNQSAIALYRKLGFEHRAEFSLTTLRRKMAQL